MITVSDMVSLETPPKNEAAPIRAKAPGSIHSQNLSVGTPREDLPKLPLWYDRTHLL